MASGVVNQSISGFDFNKLCETFCEICPDFRCQTPVDKSQSLDFANKVLFEIGPKMRHIKQSGMGQMWRLIFSGGKDVFIYSYTFNIPTNVTPHVRDRRLYLTLKQAGLLAAAKLCSLMPAQHNPRDKILLTPLARNVFAPQNVPKIAMALTLLLGRAVDCGQVIKIVISSCQTDGFHLQHSESHVALVAIEATVTMAALRQKLRDKTLRLYAKHGKIYDAAQYAIYAQHSKLAQRPPDVVPPSPGTSQQVSQIQTEKKSIETILRSIVRAADDPLSGGTLEIQFIAPPPPQPAVFDPRLPAPINIQVNASDLECIRSVQLPERVAPNRSTLSDYY